MEKRASADEGRTEAFSCREAWLANFAAKGCEVKRGHFPEPKGGLGSYTLIALEGSGRLVLLAHGTGNDQLFTWQRLIEALVANGCSVLSFDLPGHGMESSTLFGADEFWSAGETIATLLTNLGYSQKTLIGIGYSLGGLFLLNAAREGRLAFARLVLLGVPLRISIGAGFVFHEALSVVSRDFLKQWRRYGWEEAVPAFGDFRREDFPIRIRPEWGKTYPACVDDLLTQRPPPSLILESGQKCTLILGGRDRLAPPADSVHWRRSAPELRLVVIDRANHFLLPFLKPTIDAIIHELPE